MDDEEGSEAALEVRASEIEESDGRAMVAAILEAPFHVEPAATLLPVAWEIAVQHDRSVYDGGGTSGGRGGLAASSGT